MKIAKLPGARVFAAARLKSTKKLDAIDLRFVGNFDHMWEAAQVLEGEVDLGGQSESS
jgi:hypothetical protein